MVLSSRVAPAHPSDAVVDIRNVQQPVNQRVPELDGIRGVAIGLVLLWHYVFALIEATSHSLWAYFQAAGALAWSGVDLFFVLSGFLIGGILLDSRERPDYFRRFYRRRFFRIVPIYFAVLCLTLAMHRGSIDPKIPTLSYFALVQNFWMARLATFGLLLGATWSLAVEEQFYLTLPTIIRLVNQRHLTVVLTAGVILAPLLRIVLYLFQRNNEVTFYVMMPCRADALLLGVSGAWALRDPRISRWTAANGRHLFACLAVFAVGFALLTHFSANRFLMVTVGYTWIAAFYLLVLVCAVTQKESWLAKIMRWNWLGSLGTIAYAVYLTHQLIGMALFRWLRKAPYLRLHSIADALVLVTALLVTLVICNLSWRFFEKPMIAVGHGHRVV